MPDRPIVISIQGPTGIGKSELAIQVARYFDCAIISADSRQVYKEMCIGTARLTENEQMGIPHFLMGHKSIFDRYDAQNFAEDALEILASQFENKSFVVVCGGSGFYLKALLEGFDDIPKVPTAFRDQLESDMKLSGIEPLIAELQNADPDYFEMVDHKNIQRVLRALEVIRFTGKPFSSFLKGEKRPFPYELIKIAIYAERPLIYKKIEDRVDVMMARGLLTEVKNLLPHKDLQALQTVGYSELFEYLKGDMELDQAIERIKINTRHFAKRQLTWLRRENDLNWFDMNDKEIIIPFISNRIENVLG